MPAAERPIQFLIQSLRAQPLLIVLRPAEPLAASPQLERLQERGSILDVLDDDARRLQAERALQNSLRNTR